MKVLENWDLINEAGEVKRLPGGPQICKIIEAIDVPEKEYLDVYFDIAEGEYKGYFSALFNSTNKNYGRTARSYKSAATPFFKAFITAVEKSNPGYEWNWDEKTLSNKYVVVVFREEEYLVDGQVKIMARPDEFRSIQAFKEGKIVTKPLKKLESAPTETAIPVAPVGIDDKDLPF